eukprot:Plantae.Rhodophyta-Purpureofilum_apyrenoidigerum.ctg20514.p1 GENE.Plantae.Rhodophyta-Purpureofilum_apyrenoidigerum.ctg20514~~Plantae.Rhodophyta-Purpureofilum_apyrenoidigerum.ctg20514.p1  ORF type:complete len:328 (+),score=30.00 Plantae.Rhodophyta-Purpureofilum_apyrenoidigerum.ctg20514:104-985(+)
MTAFCTSGFGAFVKNRAVVSRYAGGGRRLMTCSSAPSVAAESYMCPQCREKLSLDESSCANCGARYGRAQKYVNRIPREKTAGWTLELAPAKQEMFRLPLVSWLYERGWRNNFRLYGFPGPDKEFQSLVDVCADNNALGKVSMDLSCGSGFMARKMVQSGKFGSVVVVDFSESMLNETLVRFERENIDTSDVDFIRADAGKLPLASESINVIHNGAALHCYPRVQDALREMYRVLTDGGVLFGTTIHSSAPTTVKQTFRLFSSDEVFYLLRAAGFSNPVVERYRQCVTFKAVK